MASDLTRERVEALLASPEGRSTLETTLLSALLAAWDSNRDLHRRAQEAESAAEQVWAAEKRRLRAESARVRADHDAAREWADAAGLTPEWSDPQHWPERSPFWSMTSARARATLALLVSERAQFRRERDEARASERAAVVAWLHASRLGMTSTDPLGEAADAIARGEHLEDKDDG